jgi:hypothetical protein
MSLSLNSMFIYYFLGLFIIILAIISFFKIKSKFYVLVTFFVILVVNAIFGKMVYNHFEGNNVIQLRISIITLNTIYILILIFFILLLQLIFF